MTPPTARTTITATTSGFSVASRTFRSFAVDTMSAASRSASGSPQVQHRGIVLHHLHRLLAAQFLD